MGDDDGGDGGGGGGGGAILPPEEERKPPKPNDHVFIRGSSVEVLKGAFFTATVLLEPSPSTESSKQKLLVQYHNLLADEGGPERLVEYVDILSVRPEPPSSQERVEGFEVGEVVDAYRNDGWWTGVVAQLVGGGGEKSRLRFTVSFSHSKEVRDFRASDLRPHWDWADSAWIKPEKQQVRSTPHIRKYSRVAKRCALPQSRVCSTTPKRRSILRARQQDHIDRTAIAEDSTSDSPNSPRKRRRRRSRVGAQSVTESETTETCKDPRSSGKSRGRPRKNSNQASTGKRRGRPRKSSLFKDSASGEQTKENDPEIEEILNMTAYSELIDNRSLSMSIEEMQSPPTVASKSVNRGNNENLRIEMYKDRTNGEMLQEDIGNNLENNQQRNVSLPFVKNNDFWETIESMDVFKRTPQSPHFTPLKNFGECSREGLAIGLMVTFTSIVDKVSKLRFSDPQSIIGDILGTLADLESHGFDVREVRKRVDDFLAIRDKNRDRLVEEKQLKNELVVRQYEKTKISEEMDEMERQRQKLQSADAKANEDIASLRSKLWEVREVIKNAEEDWLKSL